MNEKLFSVEAVEPLPRDGVWGVWDEEKKADALDWDGDPCKVTLYRWKLPGAELVVAAHGSPKNPTYYWRYDGNSWQPSPVRLGGRLEARTPDAAKTEALARTALWLVPQLAWVYDALGIRRVP